MSLEFYTVTKQLLVLQFFFWMLWLLIERQGKLFVCYDRDYSAPVEALVRFANWTELKLVRVVFVVLTTFVCAIGTLVLYLENPSLGRYSIGVFPLLFLLSSATVIFSLLFGNLILVYQDRYILKQLNRDTP